MRPDASHGVHGIVRFTRGVVGGSSHRTVRYGSIAGVLAATLLVLRTPHAMAATSDELQTLARVDGALGVVLGRNDADITAPSGGVITRIHVRVGQSVSRGQVLVQLDDEDARHQLDIARAAVRSAEADIERSRANADVAAKILQRRLAAPDIYSAEEIDRTRGAAEVAAAGLHSDQAHLVEQRARLDQMEANLARRRILAPTAGTVSACYRDVGTTVETAAPLMRLVGSGGRFVRFAVPTGDLARFRAGARVEIVSAEQPALRTGVVRSIAPETDAAIGMIVMEADLDDGGVGARVGTAVRVRPRR